MNFFYIRVAFPNFDKMKKFLIMMGHSILVLESSCKRSFSSLWLLWNKQATCPMDIHSKNLFKEAALLKDSDIFGDLMQVRADIEQKMT